MAVCANHNCANSLRCLRASMRPRRVRLGWPARSRTTPRPPMCFNEAEARAPRMDDDYWRCAWHVCPASMRPRRVRLGWVRRARQGVAAIAASMRPRRVRLGWYRHLYQSDGRNDASMRPRRVRLGWRRMASRRSRGPGCFNDAEARAPRMVGDLAGGEQDGEGASMRPRRVRLGWVPGAGAL